MARLEKKMRGDMLAMEAVIGWLQKEQARTRSDVEDLLRAARAGGL